GGHRLAAGQRPVGGARPRGGGLRQDRDEGPQPRVARLDPGQVVRDQLSGTDLAAPQRARLLHQGQVVQFRHVDQYAWNPRPLLRPRSPAATSRCSSSGGKSFGSAVSVWMLVVAWS